MQTAPEPDPKNNNSGIIYFSDRFLKALECSDEVEISNLLIASKHVLYPFETFANQFDKKASLLRHIFSQKFQRLPRELQNQIHEVFLRTLDYKTRDGNIYPTDKEMLTELLNILVISKHMPEKKRARYIDRIISKAYMYCYQVLEDIASLEKANSATNTDRTDCIKIVEQITDELVSLELFEQALFFAYLAYRYLDKDHAYRPLTQIIIILANHLNSNSNEHIASYRAFFFQEIKTVSFPTPQSILSLLETSGNWLYDREKKVLLRLIELWPLSDEEKLHYYLIWLKLESRITIDLHELIRLSKKIDKITKLEIFDNLKNLICDLRHNFAMDHMIFLCIHDDLALKNNIPTLCQQSTGFNSIDLYHQDKQKSYQKNLGIIPFVQTLTSACLSKNYELIDMLIADLLNQVKDEHFSIDDPALDHLNLLVVCVFDLVYDYLVQKYPNDDRITKILLRSYSVELLKDIKQQDFIKCLDWKELAKIFTMGISSHTNFANIFLTLLENLPNNLIAKRIGLLNTPSGEGDYPLGKALEIGDDQLAVRLYILGARKSKVGDDPLSLLTTAINKGCVQLATQILNREKTLRSQDTSVYTKLLSTSISGPISDTQNESEQFYLSLNTSSNGNLDLDTLALIRTRSRFGITKLPPLNAIESLILFTQMFQELADPNPMNNLVQAFKLAYILQNCPSVDYWIKNYYQSHDNYLLLRELHKKYSQQDKHLPGYFHTSPQSNANCAMLRLQQSNLIRSLNPHFTHPYNNGPSKKITITGRGIEETILPQRASDISTTHQVLLSAIKSKLLKAHPYTTTSLIKLLKIKQEEASFEEKLSIDQIYLIFDQFIELADFESSGLAYLLLCFPQLELTAPSFLPEEQYLTVRAFQLIKAAYIAGEEFVSTFLNLVEDRRFFKVVDRLKKRTLFREQLPNFLVSILPEQTDLIQKTLSVTSFKPASLSSAQIPEPNADQSPEERFELALKNDHIDIYKSLTRQFSELFQKNKYAHALKLCSKDNNQILAFLFLQHKLRKFTFTADEMTAILKEIIVNNASANNLVLALNHQITVPKSTAQTTTSDCLYHFALQEGKLSAADLLMPTNLTSHLLRQTALHGNLALFKRALNLNCKLEGKEQNQITFQELESICMNDKDKLTAIALCRLITKKQWEDQFGKTQPKRIYKPKTTNPSGEEKVENIRHHLDLLKSYAKIHNESKNLSEDDLKACNLILKKLNKAYSRCGDKNIEKFLKDIWKWHDLKLLLKNLAQEFDKLQKKEALPDAIIIAQLEGLTSLLNKGLEPQAAVAIIPKDAPSVVSNDAATAKKKKKKKIKQNKKEKNEPSSSSTPLVIKQSSGLYGFFEEKKSETANTAEQKEEFEERSPHHLSNSTLEINADIEKVLDQIKNYTIQIPNAHELQTFSQKDCRYLLEQCSRLKELFWELDDDLNDESFSLYKEQLHLLDCSLQDEETQQQVTLFALQFLTETKQKTKAPVEKTEKAKSLGLKFFQPAILQEDINLFCIQKINKLRLLRNSTDIDDIHFCVFRIVNALGDIYRSARKIRHLLIHQFYNINDVDLYKFAEQLLEINLADRRSFLAIERTALHDQSHDFMLQLLKPTKKEKINMQNVLQTKLEQLITSHNKQNKEKTLWCTALIGEIAKQIDVCSTTGLSEELATQCIIVRNKVAHENYKESLSNATNTDLICNLPVTRIEFIANNITSLLTTELGMNKLYTPR